MSVFGRPRGVIIAAGPRGRGGGGAKRTPMHGHAVDRIYAVTGDRSSDTPGGYAMATSFPGTGVGYVGVIGKRLPIIPDRTRDHGQALAQVR